MWCYDPCGGIEKATGSEYRERTERPPFIEQRVPRYIFRLMGARRSACQPKAPMQLSLGLFLFLQNRCFTLLLIQVDLAILTKIYPDPRYRKIRFFSITLASELLG